MGLVDASTLVRSFSLPHEESRDFNWIVKGFLDKHGTPE